MKNIITIFFLTCFCKLFSQSSTVYIPVVFHVVYGNATENISDAQILQHLQSLNFDFSDTNCLNTYTQDANTNIQFCLAATDPNGNPTNGITRTSTTTASFTSNNSVKFTAQGGHDIWSRDKYLNIWICDLGASLMGYGQPPGGNASTDGLVSHYKYLNGGAVPYNLGKTDVHELGHWLGLAGHPGGDCITDGDGIADTPMQGVVTSCGATGIDPCSSLADSILAKNFMQYSDDPCRCFFTPGQAAKMWTTLNGTRASLLSSSGCGVSGINNAFNENSISVFPNPSSGIFNVNVDLPFNEFRLSVFNSFGQEIEKISSRDNLFSFNLSGQPSGIYYFNIISEGFSITKKLAILK